MSHNKPATTSIDPKVVTLQDGIKTEIDGKEVPYTRVILRPATVAMDMQAIELSERLVMIGGVPTLKMSEEIYRIAMTMLRIERFECVDSNIQPIDHSLIDMRLMGRLHPYDMSRIEQGILLHDMSESLRYGNITQAQFDDVFAKDKPAKDTDQAPQPKGESGEAAAELAANAGAPRPTVTRLDK